MSKGILLTAALALGGCSALGPTAGMLELEHISHPMVGTPVTSDQDQFGNRVEDGLTQVNLVLAWQLSPRLGVEQGLGWNVFGRNGGGFYGPGLTYSGRVVWQLWGKE